MWYIGCFISPIILWGWWAIFNEELLHLLRERENSILKGIDPFSGGDFLFMDQSYWNLHNICKIEF